MSEKLLNRYQRSSVANTLRALEVVLQEALSDLGSDSKGILYRRQGTLPAEQIEQVQQLIDAGLADVKGLAQALDLPVETYDNRAALLGHLSVLWVDLHEIRAESLRRYGEVHPALESKLNPAVERLIGLITALMNILQAQ